MFIRLGVYINLRSGVGRDISYLAQLSFGLFCLLLTCECLVRWGFVVLSVRKVHVDFVNGSIWYKIRYI